MFVYVQVETYYGPFITVVRPSIRLFVVFNRPAVLNQIFRDGSLGLASHSFILIRKFFVSAWLQVPFYRFSAHKFDSCLYLPIFCILSYFLFEKMLCVDILLFHCFFLVGDKYLYELDVIDNFGPFGKANCVVASSVP